MIHTSFTRPLWAPRWAFPLLAATVVSSAMAAPTASTLGCQVTSGEQRLPVVELFTSEGCSSCPPADRQLADIGRGSSGAAAPLALHVNFWDHLGWRDPYAQAAFTDRQRRMVEANGSRTVYTPHVFVSGREVRDRSQVGDVIRRMAAAPSPWRITLQAQPSGPQAWSLAATAVPVVTAGTARATGAPMTAEAPVDLVVAVTEDGLASKVRAGENAGELLRHAHVVRHWWQSPGDALRTPDLNTQVTLSREQGAKGLDVVAFIQDRRTAEILQAVRLPGCLRG